MIAGAGGSILGPEQLRVTGDVLASHPVDRDAWRSVIFPVQIRQPSLLLLSERHRLQLLLESQEALLRRVRGDERVTMLNNDLSAAPVLREQLQQRRLQASRAGGGIAALRRS